MLNETHFVLTEEWRFFLCDTLFPFRYTLQTLFLLEYSAIQEPKMSLLSALLQFSHQFPGPRSMWPSARHGTSISQLYLWCIANALSSSFCSRMRSRSYPLAVDGSGKSIVLCSELFECSDGFVNPCTPGGADCSHSLLPPLLDYVCLRILDDLYGRQNFRFKGVDTTFWC